MGPGICHGGICGGFNLSPKLQLWWGTFAHDFELSQWQDSNGRSKQVFLLKQPFPKGRTGLDSALDRAASILGNAQFADTVFLVTDGGDKFRTGKPQQVVESVAGRAVRDFVFFVDSGVSKTPEVREAPENMEELRRQPGGVVFRLPWSKERISSGAAAALAKQIQGAAASPYEVDFQLATR